MTSAGHQWPDDVRTLAIDVGGSGFKAAVLDREGTMLTERVRIDTPYPVDPAKFVGSVLELTHGLGERHRVTVGFPGLVRNGRVRNIPSLTRASYDGDTDPALEEAWMGYDLAAALSEASARRCSSTAICCRTWTPATRRSARARRSRSSWGTWPARRSARSAGASA
jgi:hypothetical protein